MSSSVATNVVVKVEDVDDGNDKKNEDVDQLVVPLPSLPDSGSHDEEEDENEPTTSSLHELSESPDSQLPREQASPDPQLPREQVSPDPHSSPREQDHGVEKATDQLSASSDDNVPEKPYQSSSSDDITSQEPPPSSADDTTDNANLLTSI